jgi:hypothetical protein
MCHPYGGLYWRYVMTVNYNFKLEPFEHQKQALTAAGRRPEFGFFMEMGTGKSKVLLDNIGSCIWQGW